MVARLMGDQEGTVADKANMENGTKHGTMKMDGIAAIAVVDNGHPYTEQALTMEEFIEQRKNAYIFL